MKRSTFTQLLLAVVVMFGLFAAPFAEAGTLAVNQVAMATTPNHDLTATTASTVARLGPVGQRSTDAVEATLLTENKMIGGVATAKFASASYKPSVAMLEKRSCAVPDFV